MAHCAYTRTTNRGNQIWGGWVCNTDVEHNIIAFCRKAFKGRYSKFWIDPLWFDDTYWRYTERFYKEVVVALYPKLTWVKKKSELPPEVDYEDYIWTVAHEDIAKSQCKKYQPQFVAIRGSRTPEGKETIVSIRVVSEDYALSAL